jgi:hypothetical protein
LLDDLVAKRRKIIARRLVLKGELTRPAANMAALDRAMRLVHAPAVARVVRRMAAVNCQASAEAMG